MELTFRRDDMEDALKDVIRATGSRSLPILASVLISANDPLPGLLKPHSPDKAQETDSGIHLAATDLEIGIRASIPGQVIESGAIALPAREFIGMMTETAYSDVRLVADHDGKARVECGSAQFKIKGLPADEFPSLIPLPDSDTQPELMSAAKYEIKLPTVTMDSKALAAMIGMTSFAVSRDETRYFLNGAHLSLRENNEGDATGCLVTMAATDGARLAVATARAKDNAKYDKGVIIPVKAMAQLRNMLPRSDTVGISIYTERIVFDISNTMLVSRLIEGEYPDYANVIPAKNSIMLTVKTQRLLSMSRRVATMANPKTPGARVEVKGDTLRMSSSTPEFGEACEEMQIKKEGDDIELGLNIRYLMDALRVIQTDEMTIGIDEPLKPVLIKPASEDGYLYVLMPIRL